MPTFHYKARTTGGELTEGTLEAADKYALARAVRTQGAVVMHAEEEGASSGSVFAKLAKMGEIGTIPLHAKIVMIRNLAAMLQAGLPLTRALGVLEKQEANKAFKKVQAGLIEEISQGSTFADAIKKYPKIFPPLFAAMTKAGEESGTLPESLIIVGEHFEKSYQLRKKIKGAMMYPSVVVSAMIIIGILMMLYVVPTLTATFASFNVALPLSTTLIIDTSNFMIAHTIIVIGGLVVAIAAIVAYFRTKQGGIVFAWIVLHIPVIGNLAKETNSAATTRTLSALLSSGVAMTQAISITQDVVQNPYFKNVLGEAAAEVQKGIALSEVMGRYNHLYPVIVTEMIAVGEETGKLADMLMRIATFFEEDVDQQTKDLSTIIEPFLMVVIGGGVGFFAISMLSPMYSLSSSIN